MCICLVLGQGYTTTTAADCEQLLVNYFLPEFTYADKDRLQMFISTATKWLKGFKNLPPSQEVTVNVLEKMARAVDVLSAGSNAPHDSIAGIPDGNDNARGQVDHKDWVHQLYLQKDNLISFHGTLYRRLLHALENAYKWDILHGNQDMIRAYLHDQLETSHNKYGSACEVSENCPWVGHRKQSDSHYAECDLLSKAARPATLHPPYPDPTFSTRAV